MEETNEKESPPLKIDPKCIHDALRAFLPPIKNDDARLDFYTMYKKEATEYDTDYVKKYDEDLNTTLIFAGLFSAVSSAFVLGIQSKLEPDPNEQSAALLRAILLTLNRSAIPDESPTIPPTHEDTPDVVTIASCLMYASLLVSLLAAFIAMLGKQWLNRYLRNTGGSMVERCGDRQRKLEGLERWPFHTFVESLPVMLQFALLLLACGLCRQMASVNTSVASVLIALTTVGVLFYLGIVVAGTSSYECPFQTPASTALRNSWKRIQPRMSPVVHPVICALRNLWDVVLCQALRTALRLPLNRFHYPHPPSIGEDLPTPRFPVISNLWRKVRFRISPVVLPLPLALTSTLRSPSPSSIQHSSSSSQEFTQILRPKDLAAFPRINGSDARCASWILNSITDPEAVDAAIRLAGTIRWFEGRTDFKPPYDPIVSVFEACFDAAGNVYPGQRDRAYYSLKAILWMHALAECKSREFAQRHPLPIRKESPVQDDLAHLLAVCRRLAPPDRLAASYLSTLYHIPKGASYVHTQWASDLLLHLAWSKRGDTTQFYYSGEFDRRGYLCDDLDTTPLDVMLNRFLVWCIFLGSPVEEEVLRIQDKSDRLERVSDQLCQAIVTVIAVPHNSENYNLLQEILRSLAMWKSRPPLFTRMAYNWCAAICERRADLEADDGGGRTLLFLSLEVGFRHLDFRKRFVGVYLAHTEHHRRMVDVVFKDGSGEVIADLLHAWTSRYYVIDDSHEALHTCARHLVDIQRLQPLSPRLRHLVIISTGLLDYRVFEPVGSEKLFELLDHLRVRVEDTGNRDQWAEFLLSIIHSPHGIRRLSYPYWELLVERTLKGSKGLRSMYHSDFAHIIESLEDAEEWERLEYWLGFNWVYWGPGFVENLESATLSLFHQRPGAVQKLGRWMEGYDSWGATLRSVCERWRLSVAGQHTPLTPLDDGGSEATIRSLQLAIPLSFVGDDTF